MRRVIHGFVAVLALCCQGVGFAQIAEDEAKLKSGAYAATRLMGEQVAKGNFSYTLQRMYPRWKTKTAKEMGGMDKLEKLLIEVPRQMRENGVAILSFKPGMPAKLFEVRGAIIPDPANPGKKKTIYTEWLAFVPTTTKYLMPNPQTGKNVRVEKTGFQVAVSRKEENDWYFIDGSSLDVEELRRLFPALPATKEALKLPVVGPFKEVK